ncbi:molybdopterin-dependent oxidoreductase [Streptomyces altiplanensis]
MRPRGQGRPLHPLRRYAQREQARRADVLLALRMRDRPLGHAHGGPVRPPSSRLAQLPPGGRSPDTRGRP